MIVTFYDLQRIDSPMNGKRLENLSMFNEFVETLRGREPFMFELHGDGVMLTIGLANECATIQFSSIRGLPPYFMAVADVSAPESEFVEFLAGDTPTPISRRYCLPIDRVEMIVDDFLGAGGRSKTVSWEEI